MKKVSIRFASPCLAGATLALSIVGMANAQDPPRFQVTDLGSLGFVPDPEDEGTFGINSNGEVVYSLDVRPIAPSSRRVATKIPSTNVPATSPAL